MNDFLAEATAEEIEGFINGLTPATIQALPWMFDFWALPHQRPPEGEWATWVVLGGRGAGKTRAGSEWVRAQVEGKTPMDRGVCQRVALIGETLDQVREIMVLGESGIRACSPPDRRPEWVASRRTLVWPNGAEAVAMSASSPENLRGPQFDAAWCDELAKWKHAKESWDMLQMGLRLGTSPRTVVTTTPRRTTFLKKLLEAGDTVTTRATTRANRANLAPEFIRKVEADYGGTRLGRQELDGELLEDAEGALWTPAMLESLREFDEPDLDRVVVAVDPPAASGKSSDECGIVVAGVVAKGSPGEWKAYVLADLTVSGMRPSDWAGVVAEAARRYEADRIVAEVNMGGEMVTDVLRQVDPSLPVRPVRATRGKILRAEPVAALYEQGRVRHLPGLAALEEQMSEMTATGYNGSGSPDRVDALVWALTDLMIRPSQDYRKPGVRTL